MRRAGSRIVLAATVACGALAACSSDRNDEMATETLRDVVARIAAPASGAAGAPVAEPASYTVDFDRYVSDQAGDGTVGEGARQRKALKPTKFSRTVIRPYDQTGFVERSIGYVREQGGASKRVTFVRPLPDDPRPRLYPPPPTPGAKRLVIADRACTTSVVDEHEYCIDDAGLVLMNRGTASLEIATKVTVTATTKSPEELAAALAGGFVEKDLGSIRPIHFDSAPPGTDFSLDAPPAGFAFIGRYAVTPLTSEVLERSRKIVAGIVDVYMRGIDALIVERGGKLDITAVGDEDIGSLLERHDVDLGALGKGEAGIGGEGPFGYREVRAFPALGRYIVVAGTLPEEELVAVARSLRSWPGTTIRYLDGRPSTTTTR